MLNAEEVEGVMIITTRRIEYEDEQEQIKGRQKQEKLVPETQEKME